VGSFASGWFVQLFGVGSHLIFCVLVLGFECISVCSHCISGLDVVSSSW